MRYESRAESRPPARRTVLVIVVALLAIAAGLVIALSLDGSPGTGSASPTTMATESPSQTPNDTSQPSASPNETPEVSDTPASTPSPDATATPLVRAPDEVLPRFSIARVTADGLRVRTAPSTSASLVTTLAAGDLVLIGSSAALPSGPVAADGFTWYQVTPLDNSLPTPPRGSWVELVDESEDVSWIAAGDASGRFLDAVPARCVADDPKLELLDAWTPWERLSCRGNRSITFEGVYGCGGCGGLVPGEWEPAWLASPLNFNIISVAPNERIGPMDLRFPPDGREPPEAGSIIRVTGHFDDPAASGCVRAPGDPPVPEDPRMSELYCRMQFVVESYEIIGTFDDFPMS